MLRELPRAEKFPEPPAPAPEIEVVESSIANVAGRVVARTPPKFISPSPFSVNEPFPPDVAGLEEARLKCRFNMDRIIQELKAFPHSPFYNSTHCLRCVIHDNTDHSQG